MSGKKDKLRKIAVDGCIAEKAIRVVREFGTKETFGPIAHSRDTTKRYRLYLGELNIFLSDVTDPRGSIIESPETKSDVKIFAADRKVFEELNGHIFCFVRGDWESVLDTLNATTEEVAQMRDGVMKKRYSASDLLKGPKVDVNWG